MHFEYFENQNIKRHYHHNNKNHYLNTHLNSNHFNFILFEFIFYINLTTRTCFDHNTKKNSILFYVAFIKFY